MRIESKFRDYYDSAGLVYGIDNRLIYKRITLGYKDVGLLKTYENLLLNYAKDIPRYCKLPNSNITPMVIGFCGRIYSAWSFRYLTPLLNYECVFTTADQFNNFLLAHNLVNCVESFNKNKSKEVNKKEITEWSVKEWCLNKNGFAIKDELFLYLNAPIFSCYVHSYWGCGGLKTNPCLKDLGFSHLVDSLEAFNQIAMYLGRLTNREELIDSTTGDDAVLLQKSGFYEKSFKQTAPLKKEKRRLNKETKRK